MNKILAVLIILVLGSISALRSQAQQSKTDLARDVFVETSATNFVLVAKEPRPSGKQKVGFELSAPQAGKYALVCFVDGKPRLPFEFQAPGAFELSTRGLAPGSHRVTLQLVDESGRVGAVTKKLDLK